jgi:predicted nucleotidyltransferase
MKPKSNKLLHKLYIQTAKQKVMEVIFQYPEQSFSLSDLAKEAEVAKANIGEILNDLQKYNLIQLEKLSKIWRIKANQENPLFLRSKILYNLQLIYLSDLIEMLNKYYNNPKAIILFGSFCKGEDISTSDIDIAIESDNIKEYTVESQKHFEIYETIFKRKGKIQIHLFNRKNIDVNVFNNIANGIILSGFLEVKP